MNQNNCEKYQNLVVVETSFANKDQAKKISEIILQKKLAACVEFIAIESNYFWQDNLCFETEILLRIKTTKSNLEPLIDELKQLHPYQLPQIIFYDVLAEKNYGNWVLQNSNF